MHLYRFLVTKLFKAPLIPRPSTLTFVVPGIGQTPYLPFQRQLRWTIDVKEKISFQFTSVQMRLCVLCMMCASTSCIYVFLIYFHCPPLLQHLKWFFHGYIYPSCLYINTNCAIRLLC